MIRVLAKHQLVRDYDAHPNVELAQFFVRWCGTDSRASGCALAWSDGELVGALRFRRLRARVFKEQGVWVADGMRGQGIAAKLLAAVLRRHGFKRMYSTAVTPAGEGWARSAARHIHVNLVVRHSGELRVERLSPRA